MPHFMFDRHKCHSMGYLYYKEIDFGFTLDTRKKNEQMRIN